MERNNNELVTDWVKRHKLLLYKLGYVFLEVEEVIEVAIKKTVEVFKDGVDFSEEDLKYAFVSECLKHRVFPSIKPFENIQDAVQIHCLFFKYVLHMSAEEIARYLQITPSDVEKNINLGFEALIEAEKLEKCETTVEKLVNYHEGRLSFAEYKEINLLLAENNQCSDVLESVLAIIDELYELDRKLVPTPYFLEENRPLTAVQLKRKKRKQQIFTTTFALALIVGVIISSVGVAEIQYQWKLWTSERVGYGESVFVSTIDQDIEITITHVAADSTQTMLFYEIRDLEDKYNYNLNSHQGMMFEIVEKDIFQSVRNGFYSSPRYFRMNYAEEVVNQGRLILPPIANEHETITVHFQILPQVEKGTDMHAYYDYQQRNLIRGDWILEVPVTKYEPRTVEIDKTIDVKGKEVYLSHLEVAPTATFLVYNLGYETNEQRYEYHDLQFSHIKANGKEYFPDYNLDFGRYKPMGSIERFFPFESIYYLQPRELELVLSRLYSNYDYQQEVQIDYDNLPMEIPFLDNTITIKEVEVGNPVFIKIEEELDLDRSYDSFHLDVAYQNRNWGYGISSEGIWIDGEGNQYSSYEELMDLDNIFDLRYISTEQTIEIYLDGEEFDEAMLPEKIMINSYSKTHLLTDKVIKLELQ
ncbi:DUF4179 domain-containing protein [Anaerobacillus sp. CMMVII]|uniref:DUF4179 domain-containing protein n=1 Tax=Anaerobacillus sp. CMMVII TaxID=2755588 RepID=UPI0021B81F68|nr:DUF4179 domain-containing protein [Anaerobacillus sp. CMMVII]MCT8138147.1 DUF4179 domain-containing protein [Anaerobacillus sp. CMMVII]